MPSPFEPVDSETNRRRIIGQLQRITARQSAVAVAELPGAEPGSWQQTGEFAYLYRRDSLLIMDEDLATHADALPGGTLTQLDGYAVLTDYDDPRPVPELVAALNTQLGTRVTPDHVLHIAPVYSICPAVEPLEPAIIRTPTSAAPVPVPGPVPAGTGRRITVHIVDTGIDPATVAQHGWLAHVDGDTERSFGPDGTIKEYAGHGTFTAGVLAAAAPNADVYVTGGLDVDLGATAFESRVIDDLMTLLNGRVPPNVIVINAGYTTGGLLYYPGADEPPVLQRLRDVLSRLADTVIVCPAGNYGNERKFWPAASDFIVGVGGLDESEERLPTWSNRGDWVDVYTRGIHLNAFLTGEYTTKEPQTPPDEHRSFGGMAVWAGTSFAAPLVAGKIAQWASDADVTTVEAWQRVRSLAEIAPKPSGYPTIATDHDKVPYLP